MKTLGLFVALALPLSGLLLVNNAKAQTAEASPSPRNNFSVRPIGPLPSAKDQIERRALLPDYVPHPNEATGGAAPSASNPGTGAPGMSTADIAQVIEKQRNLIEALRAQVRDLQMQLTNCNNSGR